MDIDHDSHNTIPSNNIIINRDLKNAHAESSHDMIHTRAQKMVVSTAIEYFISNTIIATYEKNSLCFKWFSESNALKCHKIISSKLYSLIVVIIGLILGITAESLFGSVSANKYNANSPQIIVANVFIFIAALLTLVYGISLALILNLKIIYLIANTFDFWIKILNLIAIDIALIMLDTLNTYSRSGLPYGVYIFEIIIADLFLILIFFIDGLSFPFKIKTAVGISGSMYICYKALDAYFRVPDVVWNPFKSFEHSEISFKSVYISCLMNLVLFMLKPFLSMVMRTLRKRVCEMGNTAAANKTVNQQKNDHENSQGYQRCSSVYKRPYLHWISIE